MTWIPNGEGSTKIVELPQGKLEKAEPIAGGRAYPPGVFKRELERELKAREQRRGQPMPAGSVAGYVESTIDEVRREVTGDE